MLSTVYVKEKAVAIETSSSHNMNSESEMEFFSAKWTFCSYNMKLNISGSYYDIAISVFIFFLFNFKYWQLGRWSVQFHLSRGRV